jgi:hypothetical protein
MFLLVDHAASGASDDRPYKVPVTPEILKLFILSDTKWNRKVPVWGRMIDGRHVLVLHNCASPVVAGAKAWYPAWRIYIDGDCIYDMLEVDNERAARSMAEVYMKSDKLRYIVKFENAMNDILQQYEKERTSHASQS